MLGLLLLILSLVAGVLVFIQANPNRKAWGLLPIGLALFGHFLLPSLLVDAGMELDTIIMVVLATLTLSTVLGFFLYNRARIQKIMRTAESLED